MLISAHSPRFADTALLHPRARFRFRALERSLRMAFKDGEIDVEFRCFETYRLPQRQHLLWQSGIATKADQYESAHQFGLAADFVIYDNTEKYWRWDGTVAQYDFLKRSAERAGLKIPITWDKGHVEHPQWPVIRAALDGTG